LYKAEPHGTENIFHIGQISALYKINNTDSSGRDYRICSHSANFRPIQVPPYISFTIYIYIYIYIKRNELAQATSLTACMSSWIIHILNLGQNTKIFSNFLLFLQWHSTGTDHELILTESYKFK
jgi:hypothetical protein